MGSLCSKPGTHSGEHVQLHDLPSPTRAAGGGSGNAQTSNQGTSAGERPDPRIAAAQAAEQRLKAVCLNLTSQRFAPLRLFSCRPRLVEPTLLIRTVDNWLRNWKLPSPHAALQSLNNQNDSWYVHVLKHCLEYCHISNLSQHATVGLIPRYITINTNIPMFRILVYGLRVSRKATLRRRPTPYRRWFCAALNVYG